MNRQERRAEKSRIRKFRVHADQVDSICDIQVDGKDERVMIFANTEGRKVVEDLWPEVEWTTDNTFSSIHSADWLFTHVRVTKLPASFETQTPLAFASPDQISLVVGMALQARAKPDRVLYYSGGCYIGGRWAGTADQVKITILRGPFPMEVDFRSLFVEHVPATRSLPVFN